MNDAGKLFASDTPRLAPHARLRFDTSRDSWTIQAPERVFMLDAVAHAIVSRCDGAATIGAIVDDLCSAYRDAPPDAIKADTYELLQNFVDKGVMIL
ncbi:MAG: pyrroloquinoline quinone biosynthesis peptide chaperone PqqD [Rhizomicrobium sp.]|jgi:pyrroloquinoline quinone biosynthesis protein D